MQICTVYTPTCISPGQYAIKKKIIIVEVAHAVYACVYELNTIMVGYDIIINSVLQYICCCSYTLFS